MYSCAAIAVVASITLDLSMIPQAGALLSPSTRLGSLSPLLGAHIKFNAVFTGLRAYALTRNRALSAVVFLISSVQFTRDLVWNFSI